MIDETFGLAELPFDGSRIGLRPARDIGRKAKEFLRNNALPITGLALSFIGLIA